MSFILSITLNAEGDALVIPFPKPLIDNMADEHEPRVKQPADPWQVELGEYPYESFEAESEAIGAGSYRAVGKMLGDHAVCGNRLWMQPISLTNRVIVCSHCFLRVTIPLSVKTYADLREHFIHFARQHHPV